MFAVNVLLALVFNRVLYHFASTRFKIFAPWQPLFWIPSFIGTLCGQLLVMWVKGQLQ